MEQIECRVCGAKVHAMAIHIRDEHPEMTLEEYTATYPDAPVLSEVAKKRIEEKKKAVAKEKESREISKLEASSSSSTHKEMHKLFGLGKARAAMRPDGSPVMIEVLDDGEWSMQVPEKDPNYVFPIEQLKTGLSAIALNIPFYFWGHSGTGKTTLIEQVCAYTNRPMIRIQHTGATEESHILGSMAANESGTYFDPGPLPLAMKYGWLYLADEYDAGFPQSMMVYQPVLEGKPLVIKEAPADSEWRVVHPHPNFIIAATGNTNMSGDESGLYQGTNIQNAANAERFGIVAQMPYMSKKQEIAVVSAQGGVSKEDAERMVEFAHKVRDAYDGKKIKATIGPRVLINAAKIAIARASFMKGLEFAFINRLNSKDREVVTQIAQRILS
ncbi:AAA family ATPase [Vibrio alginolyticus]|uniref:AAA family ATPase n=1 Tax=Vibrio alginolyticus TaxID=663 RepID=UPI002119D4F3|nr:MoxR family ATPase [Vibrio alginolyticus]MCQ9070857.1 AAA family ATPase [Vibrio alginolyticus]